MICYFGGSFNPVHLGHKEIIDTLSKKYEKVIVSVQNNWQKEDYFFSLEKRIESLKKLCETWDNVIFEDYSQIKTTFEVVHKIKKKYGIFPVIAIGSDQALNIKTWKNYNELKNMDFIIIPRVGYSNEFLLSHFEILNIENYREISSTLIRNEKRYDLIPCNIRDILLK